jgi:glycosyltransferase involved in cell wall biosynthesis
MHRRFAPFRVPSPRIRVAHECIVFAPEEIGESSGIIYQHSIGNELTSHVIAHRGPKFSSITTLLRRSFLSRTRAILRRFFGAGRAELHVLAPHFPKAANASAFNADELRECGFNEPMVLPIAVDPAMWNVPPDPDLTEQLQDGRTNILFVGRIAPNKKQDDLVRAFQAFLVTKPSSRLILVGSAENGDPYAVHLRGVIENNGLGDSVIMPGSIQRFATCRVFTGRRIYFNV